MSSAATVAPGNATTADQIDECINVHREKRSKQMDVTAYSQGLYNMVRASAAHVLGAVPPRRSD